MTVLSRNSHVPTQAEKDCLNYFLRKRLRVMNAGYRAELADELAKRWADEAEKHAYDISGFMDSLLRAYA